MTRAPAPGLQRAIAGGWPLLAMALLVGGLVVAHLEGPLRFAYPVVAVAIAARLERRSTADYVSFVIWLWFLSPLVRRIADLSAGWQEPSLVLLTPYLVTAVSVPPLLHGFLRHGRSSPAGAAGVGVFVLAGLGVAIGVPGGMLIGPSTAALETLNWFLPICFGWYIATRGDDLHRIEAAVASTFVAASAAAGAYAIYQFTNPAPWDINWMQLSGMTTIGSRAPYGVRVFGPMHSPGIFSIFLVIALVMWLARPRLAGLPAAGLAGVALLLSQVRSSWLALVIATLFVFGSLTAARRIRMATFALVAVAVVGLFVYTDEMHELVSSRIATMERLDQDESAVARWTGHGLALEFVAEHPLGAGIGQLDERTEQYISMRDSMIVGALIQFGLVGTMLYLAGVAGMVWLLASYYRRAASVQGAALASAGFGLLATIWLGVVTAGPIGVCLWMITGLAIADRERRRRPMPGPAAETPPEPRRPWRTWAPGSGPVPA